jgi:predicted dehydrogenase
MIVIMSGLNKIRIGIIGAGNIGNVHMHEFGKLTEECEITTITDVALSLAEKRAQEHGIPHVAKSPEALIASDQVDAVIIGVPNAFHADLAVQALEAGKHVLIEKPMGISGDAARQIVSAQKKSGKTVMVSHQMRWEWLPLQVKKQIDAGELGQIYAAKTGWFRRKGIPGWGTWFTRMDQAGGGPLIDIGVHMLDLTLHLMGSPTPVSVSGSTYAEFGPKRKGIGTWGTPNWDGKYDVEDLAMAIIKLDNGSTLTLDVTWAVHMDTDNQPFVHLMGTEGGASLKGDKGKWLTEKFDQPLERELITPANDEGGRIRLSRHFLECIREGKEPISSARSGLINNLIIDAIYESSKTGREILIKVE